MEAMRSELRWPDSSHLGYQRSAFLLSGTNTTCSSVCTIMASGARVNLWQVEGNEAISLPPNVSDPVAETFFLLRCFTSTETIGLLGQGKRAGVVGGGSTRKDRRDRQPSTEQQC